MTREKLLRYGKDYLHDLETACCKIDKLHLNFVRESIKALEQEPTTKNDLGVDCISRQAVLEQAYAYGNGLEPDGYCVNVEDIQALPSVTPIRPKGHWIEHEESISTAFKHLRECSCCKCYFDWMMPRNSYCPNCGAKMISEVEHEQTN